MAVRASEAVGGPVGRVEMRAGAALPLLRLEGLRKTFRGRVALEGLSVSVGEGELLGLFGPPGAGKSTALHLLAGLVRPEGGRVYLEGRQVGLEEPALRRRMGVMLQQGSVDGLLTARENLLLGARLHALPPAQARPRVEEMLAWMGFADRADERVAGWSEGMRRRLELARALVHGPRLLLLDAPTRGLDEASSRAFWRHLGQLRAAGGLTVLVATDRPEEAALCSRVAVLDGGKLLACDTPEVLGAGADLVVLEAPGPEQVAAAVTEALGLEARVVEGRVVVESEVGHALVPQLVEAFPPGRLSSVCVRRPTVADVFRALAGRPLSAERPPEAPARPGPVRKRRQR